MFSDPETVPLPKKAISLRMPPKTVAAIDRRAADSGVNRTRYILRLVDQDLAQRSPKSKRRFASIHLLGRFRSQGSSNAHVRAALKAQIARREAAAKDKIAQAEAAALNEIRALAADTAVNAAQKLIAARLDEARAKGLITDSIKGLGDKLN